MSPPETQNQQPLRSSLLWLVFLFFFLTNTLILAVFYVTLAPERTSVVRLNVPSGSGLRRIAGILLEKKVIRDRHSFEMLCKLRGMDSQLRAGEYLFPPGISLWQVIDFLGRGQGEMVRVTIPEGLNNNQVVERVAEQLPLMDRERFAAALESESLRDSLGVQSGSLMGLLFPDTYFVPPTIRESELIALMVERFNKVYAEIDSGKPSGTGLNQYQSLILASIVEKEAAAAEDRPLIASVFVNRLRLNRPLESCATVLFALGKHKSRLLYRDLRVNSPYNTYLHRGLPPGPICNPGRGSLEAAIHPADTDYLYFVARGDGTHIFSRSLREHNQARNTPSRSGSGG